MIRGAKYSIYDDMRVPPAVRWRLVINGDGCVDIQIAPGFKFGLNAAVEVTMALRQVRAKFELAIRESRVWLSGTSETVH